MSWTIRSWAFAAGALVAVVLACGGPSPFAIEVDALIADEQEQLEHARMFARFLASKDPAVFGHLAEPRARDIAARNTTISWKHEAANATQVDKVAAVRMQVEPGPIPGYVEFSVPVSFTRDDDGLLVVVIHKDEFSWERFAGFADER